MTLSEDNYEEVINSFSLEKWKPLLDLIPELDHTKSFGEIISKEKNDDGIFYMPYWVSAPIVDKFHDIVYEIPIIIDFDWSSWDQGRNMVNNDNFNYDSIDVPKKCKIITAIVRNDRFNEGALINAFESGLIQKIMVSIKNQVTQNQSHSI